MTDPLLLPDQRFVLNQLASGGELWLHDFGKTEEARLHVGDLVHRLERDDIEALLRGDLIRPVLGVTSKLYTITEAGLVWVRGGRR